PDDEHVLAAAAVTGASAIVTNNLKDFPDSKLPNGIQALHPKVFARNTVALSPTRAWMAVQAIVQRSGRHGAALDGRAVLDRLESRYDMGEAVDMLRSAAQPNPP
ncbi:MAG: PIN domain-containing protein, partial [Sciscionella sp.]